MAHLFSVEILLLSNFFVSFENMYYRNYVLIRKKERKKRVTNYFTGHQFKYVLVQ